MRCSTTKVLPRNARIWVQKDKTKKSLPAELISKPQAGFSVGVMVHLCISSLGKIRPSFCAENSKVSADSYIEMMKLSVLPEIKKVAKDTDVYWQMDNATSHSSKKKKFFSKSFL